VTDLLRDASARRGRVLANDFGRTLRDDRWQSIILGIGGVLAGILAALFVVRRTVRPLKSIAKSIARLLAVRNIPRSPRPTSITRSATSPAPAEVFRRSLVDADTAREAAIPRPGRAAARRRKLSQAVRSSVDGIYVTTPAGALLQRQSGAGTDDGI